MLNSATTIQNSQIPEIAQKAPSRVVHAIKTASHRTGVDFSYLVNQAAAESSFNASARSRTSSATGLYQFIESTWLNMVKRYGHKHGLGHYADRIDDHGRVSSPQMRKQILDLRNNPEKASILAAELAAENARYLERHLDDDYGPVGATELYFAHFLGAGGATAFLNAYKDDPLLTAADMFPQAARANRNVFYDRQSGQPRTLAGVYEFFDNKFRDESMPAEPPRQRPPAPPPPAFAKDVAAAVNVQTKPFQNHRAALAVMTPQASQGRGGSAPVFHSGRGGLAPGSGIIRNAAEIMLMAQLDPPQRARYTARHAHNNQNRYN